MAKRRRAGQAAIFASGDMDKVLSAMPGENHKMILRLCYWTAGRSGEVCALRTSDVYDSRGKPLEEITFQPQTTKTGKTRQVPVHQVLRELLIIYWKLNQPDINGYLFPNAAGLPIQQQSYDDAFRRAIFKAELNNRGYATHSPRRSILTEMAKRGLALSIIQGFSGHASLAALQKYIDITKEDVKLAIANF